MIEVERVQFQTVMRATAVELLEGYAEERGVRLQVWSGRPATIKAPTAFVDRLRESLDYPGPENRQRIVQVDMTLIHANFDSKEAADQKDAFVDGFADWVLGRYHAAGPNTLVAVRATEDDPNYVPDWLPLENGRQPVFYATLIRLEGTLED